MVPTRLVALLLMTSACAPPSARLALQRVPEAPLSGLRQVVMRGEPGEVEGRLGQALRERGFHVKRAARAGAVGTERRDRDAAPVGAPIARYVIEGAWTVRERCQGGGFLFESFQFDVVDLRVNKVVMSGGAARVHSEGCPEHRRGLPSSDPRDDGTLFGDVARLLDAVWQPVPRSELALSTRAEPSI